MSNATKTVAAVIVLIIVAGGGYYVYTHTPSQTGSNVSSGTPGMAATNTAVASLPGGSSNSDAALNSDTTAIDTQMSGLNTDNANTNSSLNDQAISQ